MVNCQQCQKEQARIKTAKDGQLRCPQCFIDWFEQDVHQTIVQTGIFSPGDRIGVGVSGGKDSTVLAHVLSRLNQRHAYGLELVLLCIDEGIKGYRDDSIREVHKNEADLQLPLVLVSYQELYGWTMDQIVARIGRKNNCTFCGVFRRQALDRAAIRAKATKLATGHNADDAAETVLMNVLRGDVGRLQRGGLQHGSHVTAASEADDESLPRIKPLKYTFEKDIVMYAHFGKLNYFSTECVYAPNAYRMNARSYIKELERVRPRAILDIVRSGEQLQLRAAVPRPVLSRCEQCGYITSQKYCKACLLLYGLNNNEPGLVVARKSKHLHDLDLKGLNLNEGQRKGNEEENPSTENNGSQKRTSSSEIANGSNGSVPTELLLNSSAGGGCSSGGGGCACRTSVDGAPIIDF